MPHGLWAGTDGRGGPGQRGLGDFGISCGLGPGVQFLSWEEQPWLARLEKEQISGRLSLAFQISRQRLSQEGQEV